MREHHRADDAHPCGDDGADDPIDLGALRADDALIDALAAGERRSPSAPADGVDPDEQLIAILATWVAGVRPEESPQPSGPEPAVVVALPVQATERRAGAGYALRAAAAAALVLIVLSGLAIGARQARPGDTLWSVSKVFYAERARSVEAATDVTNGLVRAREALHQGRAGDAAREVAGIHARLAAVRAAEGRDELVREQALLAAQLADTVAPGDPATRAVAPGPAGSARRPSPASGADAAVAAPGTSTAQAATASGADRGQPGTTTSSQSGSTTPPTATRPSSPPSENHTPPPSAPPRSEGSPDHSTAPPAEGGPPAGHTQPNHTPRDSAPQSTTAQNGTQSGGAPTTPTAPPTATTHPAAATHPAATGGETHGPDPGQTPADPGAGQSTGPAATPASAPGEPRPPSDTGGLVLVDMAVSAS
ncbi:hypothetical protein [Pseudonocardia acidicola]|uniref:Anti-sigma-D factor RsdA sigma factor binding region domain-containing protein n=1 Tax=Pseudonocardia acidicola TaxID=2724939 RepID=A0ABX1S489_9PSEU|nr:hypothetical protein [Pseudonocardia acidicola]NMH96383.1 hypothetical protein [Pseudonocardia acidicola]